MLECSNYYVNSLIICLSTAPSPLVSTSVTSAIARPNNASGSESVPAATIPEWKRVLQEKKQKEQLVREYI